MLLLIVVAVWLLMSAVFVLGWWLRARRTDKTVRLMLGADSRPIREIERPPARSAVGST